MICHPIYELLTLCWCNVSNWAVYEVGGERNLWYKRPLAPDSLAWLVLEWKTLSRVVCVPEGTYGGHLNDPCQATGCGRCWTGYCEHPLPQGTRRRKKFPFPVCTPMALSFTPQRGRLDYDWQKILHISSQSFFTSSVSLNDSRWEECARALCILEKWCRSATLFQL